MKEKVPPTSLLLAAAPNPIQPNPPPAQQPTHYLTHRQRTPDRLLPCCCRCCLQLAPVFYSSPSCSSIEISTSISERAAVGCLASLHWIGLVVLALVLEETINIRHISPRSHHVCAYPPLATQPYLTSNKTFCPALAVLYRTKHLHYRPARPYMPTSLT